MTAGWPIGTRRKVRRLLEELALLEADGHELGLSRRASEILPELRERPSRKLRPFPIEDRAPVDRGEGAAEHRRRIRAEVMMRDLTCQAAGFLGLRCSGAPEFDHFFGRGRVPETKETCWLLCTRHHRLKTDNEPNRAAWLRLFLAHAARHGYLYAARLARKALALESAQHPETVR